eukprot:204301_1
MSSKTKLIVSNGNVNNGIIQISIDNFYEIYSMYECEYQLSVVYTMNMHTQKESCPSSPLRSPCLRFDSFTGDVDLNHICLKVPLLTRPYSFKYRLQIAKTIYTPTLETHQAEEYVLNQEKHFESDVQTVHISPISFVTIFEAGDLVLFRNPTQTQKTSIGFVSKVLENDMIQIEDAEDSVLHLDRSNVALYPINQELLIDITDVILAHIELIVRPPIYGDDLNVQAHPYIAQYKSVIEWWHSEEEDVMDSLVCVLWTHIAQFLYPSAYDIRFQCIFADTNMRCIQQWQYGLEFIERKQFAYFACCLCNVSVSWFEFVFVCECELAESAMDSHVFCLSCVHSMYSEYKRMSPAIFGALDSVLNDNCIEAIIGFLVGKYGTYCACNQM